MLDNYNKDYGLVSVIMPSYNAQKYIAKSINSVLLQTYKSLELIIVDDCSSDKTVDIVKTYKDERIRLFVNETNQGAALTRNRALREAKGKYIAFLDADDIWDFAKLESQLEFMDSHKYSFTFTDYRIIYDSKIEGYIRTAPNKVNYRKLINYCYFFTSTVVYNREKVGLIQIKDLKKNNDYAMWLHALKKVDAYRFPFVYSYYVKHDESISSGKKRKLIKYHYYLFRVELEKSKVVALIMTLNNLWHGFWKKIIYKRRVQESNWYEEDLESNKEMA